MASRIPQIGPFHLIRPSLLKGLDVEWGRGGSLVKFCKEVTEGILSKKRKLWYPSKGNDIQWGLVRYPMGDLQKLHPRGLKFERGWDWEGNPRLGGGGLHILNGMDH